MTGAPPGKSPASRKIESSPLVKGSDAGGVDRTESTESVGAGHSITLFGSIALTVNSIAGPGMLEFPEIFQKAGYVPVAAVLGLVCAISSLCATLLCDAMARIPGNDAYQARHEFSDVARHFLGRGWFGATQVAFYLCLLMQNLAAIVSTSQVLDQFLADFVLGHTYALELAPRPGRILWWSSQDCSPKNLASGACVPFSYEAGYGDGTGTYDDDFNDGFVPSSGGPGAGGGGGGGVAVATTVAVHDTYGEAATDLTSKGRIVTLGYVTCTALFLYPGLLNLEENVGIQVGSFWVLLLLCGVFLHVFGSEEGFDLDRLPAIGPNWSDSIGVVIFNFAFCVTVPSWVNEKRRDVSVNTVVWSSTLFSTTLYAIMGILGAMAFERCPDNMLAMLSSNTQPTYARIAALLFGVSIIGLGIPIFSVLMRYNLVNGGVCSPRMGYFAGGVLPYLLAWLMYTGHAMLQLLSWAGLILNGFICFVCPALIALAAAVYARRGVRASFRCRTVDTPRRDVEAWVGGGSREGKVIENPLLSPPPPSLFGRPKQPAWSYGAAATAELVEPDDGGGGGGAAAAAEEEEGEEALRGGNGGNGGNGGTSGPGARGLGSSSSEEEEEEGRRRFESPPRLLARVLGGADAVPATVVRALPEGWRKHHVRVVGALVAAIAALVGLGLLLKIDDTLEELTGWNWSRLQLDDDDGDDDPSRDFDEYDDDDAYSGGHNDDVG